MTPFASVAILEKLVLLKIALCRAPDRNADSSASLRACGFDGMCAREVSEFRVIECRWCLSGDDQFWEDATWGLMRSAMSITLACPSPARLAPLSAFSAAEIRSFGTAPEASFQAVDRVESRQPPPTVKVTRP